MKLVHVAVGVVARGSDIFTTLRAKDAHQGGKWEFPGGKVESGETVTDALTRELAEEIGIDVLSSEPLILIEHDYGDKRVKLDVHRVTQFTGEPHGKEGRAEDFPEANVAIIQALMEATK